MFVEGETYLGFNIYRKKYYNFIQLHEEISGYIELIDNLVEI